MIGWVVFAAFVWVLLQMREKRREVWRLRVAYHIRPISAWLWSDARAVARSVRSWFVGRRTEWTDERPPWL